MLPIADISEIILNKVHRYCAWVRHYGKSSQSEMIWEIFFFR